MNLNEITRAGKTLQLFIQATASMREYQKKFFKEKDPQLRRDYLAQSKAFEKEVDQMLVKLLNAEEENTQQNLFKS